MNIGDKLICSNNKTYTLQKGNASYTFSIIDENGSEINMISDITLNECLPHNGEDAQRVCIGTNSDNYLMYTKIIDVK